MSESIFESNSQAIKLRNLVIGSVESFLPTIMFQAVKIIFVIEYIQSIEDILLNNLPSKVSEMLCFLSSSTIYL